MLRNVATRAAAMTILGKLTEICSDKVASNCEPAQLRELQTALSQVRPGPVVGHSSGRHVG